MADTHTRGFWRSLYYYFEWPYESDNDKPTEKDVNLKQVLMRQVSLSKLKLKKVRITPRMPPDLQPIKVKKNINIFNDYDDIKYIPPPSSPIEISQKQMTQLNMYKTNTRYNKI
tara:strand:- start:141 stop:482 length:342 start_codon:yes stop_codon:yes gene_type:complete